MKKSAIAAKISRLKGFEQPKLSLEQYVTPPQLAADLVHAAYMQGDIESCKVIDLGSGTGILAIAATLADAKEVTAVEKDEDALDIAKENAAELGVEDKIKFVKGDISGFGGSFDTCIMNPPFSVHSDTGFDFLSKAFELADTAYFISRSSSREAIKEFVENSGYAIEGREAYKIDLPPTYGFHTSASEKVEVDLTVTRKIE